jgi:hypothetical protein
MMIWRKCFFVKVKSHGLVETSSPGDLEAGARALVLGPETSKLIKQQDELITYPAATAVPVGSGSVIRHHAKPIQTYRVELNRARPAIHPPARRRHHALTLALTDADADTDALPGHDS